MSLTPERALVNPPRDADGVSYGVLRTYPRWLLAMGRQGLVEPRAILLWAEIASLTKYGRRGVCDASLAFLADQLPPYNGKPLTERTVRKYVDQLVAVRAISVEHRLGFTSVYVPHLEPLPESLPLFPETPEASFRGYSSEQRDPATRDDPGSQLPGTPEGNPGSQLPGKHSQAPVTNKAAGPPPVVDTITLHRLLTEALEAGDQLAATSIYDELAARLGPVPVPAVGGDREPRAWRPPPRAPWAAQLDAYVQELRETSNEDLGPRLVARIDSEVSNDRVRELQERVGINPPIPAFPDPVRRLAALTVLERDSDRDIRKWRSYLEKAVDGLERQIRAEIQRIVDRRLDDAGRRP